MTVNGPRLRRRLERGGAAAIVAVLLAMGSLLGFGALAIDVGNLMVERRQLQNGADATALALAGICNENAAQCTLASLTTSSALTTLNDANAKDGRNGFDTTRYPNGVCGSRLPAGSPLSTCSSATESAATSSARTGQLRECLPVPDAVKNNPQVSWVETYTRTQTTSGTILPSFLSRAVLGATDSTVHACSRAAWGPAGPASRTVLNVVMSECDWRAQTGYTGPGTAVYPNAPVGAWPGYGVTNPWPLTEQRVYTKGNPTTCDTSAPGGTAPGGFAALRGATDCEGTLTLGSDGKLWAEGDPGNDLPCSTPQLDGLRGTVVYLPVFDCMTDSVVTVTSSTDCASGNGSNNYYRISGFAAFYLAGWRLSSTSVASIRPPYAAACSGGDRCLVGWFVADLVPDLPLAPAGGGSPTYGLTTVAPAG